MDNFKIIYRILAVLEAYLDCDCFDLERLSAQHLGVSENRRNAILKMLNDKGYITGVQVKEYIDGDIKLNIDNIKITLDGLEYLA